MTILSLYSPTTAVPTLEQQHRSSSAFIAHLLVQEYPPKVQPKSSSARDKALFSHLDKVDAEAGCILIALANHDKRKDMNDLIPYSIRVNSKKKKKRRGVCGRGNRMVVIGFHTYMWGLCVLVLLENKRKG
ncbi:hypothetical protein BCR42DRAFT_187709 [Absidia repens]|uniref:Uncharacterized protein n=1 Tax=Absidia repens TaxID=90262 RepID=A0A1X2IRG9_9FUNG|nr:hypothetical protein BCR42DRAFT_187709 [Absidia repens]